MLKPNPGPKYILELKTLITPIEIIHFFKKNNIQRYLYDIKYKGQTIKYGIQHTIQKESGIRLHDQIIHMPGWHRPYKRGPEVRKSIEEMILQVCKNLSDFHKDDVVIEIYDFTDYKFKLPDSDDAIYFEIRNIETHFNNWYKEQYGRFPVGNLKQEKLQPVAPPVEIRYSLFELG